MSKDEKDEWVMSVPTVIEPEPEPDDDDDADDDGMVREEAEAAEVEKLATALTVKKRSHVIREKRSMEDCEALVKGIDDETVTMLLIAVAKEAIVRGIDPTISVSSATGAKAGGAPMANVHDLWGRVVARIDRSKRGGFRFDGSPVYGRAIIGRELSNLGVSEDGKAAPVVFGRKDMRGTIWLAVGEKGAGFDMAGTPIVGMKLLCMSNTSDGFEKLCDQAEALLAGVTAEKVTDRRTTEQKLAAIDDWE